MATNQLATLHTLQRDKPGVRLMAAATGIDLRDRLDHYEAQVQAIPKA